MTIQLYNIKGSPPCNAVRLLAKHLGVELAIRDLNLLEREHLKPEYLELNPFHKMPTIVDDGFALYESNAILYYLINKYAPDSPLYPECPRGRASVDKVLAAISSTIQPHFFAFYKPCFRDKKRPTSEDIAAFEESVLSGFQHLIGDGKYALGDSLTLADFPLVAHLAVPMEVPFHEPGTFPKLVAYYEGLKRELAGFEEICRPALEELKIFCNTQLQ